MNFRLINAVVLFAAWASAALTPSFAAEVIAPDYNKQIAPLFNKYCNACHNSDDREGKLALDKYDELLKGGKRGAVVAAGHSDQSLLVRVLTGAAKPIMPPDDNERPKPEEIALIRAWVDAGAKGPQGAAPDPTILILPKIAPTAPVRRAITAIAFSPKDNLIAVGRYGTVELVAVDTREVRRTLNGHRGSVNDLAFSADGSLLIVAGGETGLLGEVQIWKLSELFTAKPDPAKSKSAPAKKSAAKAPTAAVPPAEPTVQPLKMLRGHKDSIYSLAVSPDGKTLATGSYDQQIKLWDLENGTERKTLSGHNGGVFGLAFHPSSKLLASASGDRTIKLWDIATGERLDTLSQPTNDQYTVAFSPDGKSVVAAGIDNRIRLWRLGEGFVEGTNALVTSRFAHDQPILKLIFTADGKTLVTSAEDRKIKFWNAETLVERTLLDLQPDLAPAVAFAADGKSLVAGRLDGSLAIYNADDGKPIEATPPPKPIKPELTALSPRGIERGKTIDIKLTGKNLSAVSAVQLSDKRLTAKLIDDQEGPNSADVQIQLTGSDELPRGAYELSVETGGGVSNKLTIYVDDVPQASEIEPNDRAAQSQSIALPLGIWGTLAAPGDVDRYRFQGRAGQSIIVELSNRAIGGKANAALSLFDPRGKLLSANNDFGGQMDPLLAHTLLVDGEYSVEVNDLLLSGGAGFDYRLTVGSLPFVVACFPLSVPANKTSEVELIGYDLPKDSLIKVKAGATGEVEIKLDAKFRSRGALKVIIGDLEDSSEQEPNDAPTNATLITAPGSANGRIEGRPAGKPADVDHYRFAAKRGESYIVETAARRRGSPVDTRIDVLTADGRPIERMLFQAVRDSYINFRPINSTIPGVRLKNWEEMELNEYVYLGGEVNKIFRAPQGPDSDSNMYELNPGQRRAYFDTTSTAHANYDPVYVVEPHLPNKKLANNGLPVFPLYYSNDDAGDRDIATDSRLTFVAPADGDYLVRVVNTADSGGDRYVYRLTLREPKPDFNVTLSGMNPNVPAGSGQAFTVTRQRIDGFDGEIRVDVAGDLPPGFTATTPLVIEAGHRTATGTIFAAADAVKPTDKNASLVKVTATAEIAGRSVSKPIGDLGKISLAEQPKLSVQLLPEPQKNALANSPSTENGIPVIMMTPGSTVSARLKIDRKDFKGSVSLEVLNLPHGVIVDNIGLNAVLIPENESERQIFLTAAPWVGEINRPIYAIAKTDKNATSAPVLFKIVKANKDVAAK